MAGSKHAPYMPDGSNRTLATYLNDNGVTELKSSRKSKGSGFEKKWNTSFQLAEATRSSAADPDVQSLVLVGRNKRRRWLADTLLRKMAGDTLTMHINQTVHSVCYRLLKTLSYVSRCSHRECYGGSVPTSPLW